tara:strand:- start:11880 stop:12101 length:222 start_codon:yes stop_codon:yes gene_type:complete
MKDRWTIKEEKDGTTWWLIRGGAFTNVINKNYPHRVFDDYKEAILRSGNINRLSGRETDVVKVRYRRGNMGKL